MGAHAKLDTPIAYMDADEFNAWWAQDAARLAEVVKKIGKVESAQYARMRPPIASPARRSCSIGIVAIWESRAFPLGSLHRPGPAVHAGRSSPCSSSCSAWLVAAMGARTPAGCSPRAGHDWRHAAAIFAAAPSPRGASTGSAIGSRWPSCSPCCSWGSSAWRVVTSLVLTAGMAWGSFYLFDTLLKVPLPRGPFGL